MEEISRKAEKARAELVPPKSEPVYQKEYRSYLKWLALQKVKPAQGTETVFLAYFQEMSEKYSPNSLWTKWSMLKAMVAIQQKRVTTKFNELEVFLKRKSKGYRPKKSSVLSPTEVVTFLKEAPNEIHLLHKVVLIMGYFGACRGQELINMKISDIKDRDSVMAVNIPQTKMGIPKKFTIVNEKEFSALPILRRYISMRPADAERFFLTFRKNQCTRQPLGKNTLGKTPSKVAEYLGLPDPSYTGHCLRRTCATALIDAGASITNLKRHEGWRSTSVAEGYLEDSIEQNGKNVIQLAIGRAV